MDTKEILLDWQKWKVFHDVSKAEVVCGGAHWIITNNYFDAVDSLKTIQDEATAELVRRAYEAEPQGLELTCDGYKVWKAWKARTSAAQDELLALSLEYGSAFPQA